MVGNKKLSFKNVDGFSALSGGVIQITKNFKNFGEMTGDQDRGFKSISLKNSFFSIKNEIRIIYLPLKNIPENYFFNQNKERSRNWSTEERQWKDRSIQRCLLFGSFR